MITCCLNCTSRHKACHDTCEKYKAEKKDFEERKAFADMWIDKEQEKQQYSEPEFNRL